MKKELFAVLLLALILVLSVVNANRFGRLAEDMTALISEAAERAGSGDGDTASALAGRAKALWTDNSAYLMSILSHREFDSVSAQLYELSQRLNEKDPAAVRLAADRAIECLQDITYTESMRLGSIF